MVFSPITAAQVERYDECAFAYFLSQHVHSQSMPMSGFAAEGAWFGRYVHRLFPDDRFVGPDMKNVETLSKEELSKHLNYHSSVAFGNAISGWWKSYIIGGKRVDERTGREIEAPPGVLRARAVEWLYHGQWWHAAARLKRGGVNLYEFFQEEGLPVLTFSSDGGASIGREVAFEHKGKKHLAWIRAIRRGHVIGEYGYRVKTQNALDSDWKVTLALLAYCTLAHEQEAYRIKWAVDARVANRWGGVSMYIDPDVPYRYYDLQHGVVLETRRSDADLPEMLGRLEAAEQAIINSIDRRDFKASPSRSNCGACPYNVRDMSGRTVCDRKYPRVSTLRSMKELKEEEKRKGPKDPNKPNRKRKKYMQASLEI